jgi:hypothetical protein
MPADVAVIFPKLIPVYKIVRRHCLCYSFKMSEIQRQGGNSQTLCVEKSELEYTSIEEAGGYATVVRFRLHNQDVRIGDVLVVLNSSDIIFHGMIGRIEVDGWALAADRRGSALPVRTQ